MQTRNFPLIQLVYPLKSLPSCKLWAQTDKNSKSSSLASITQNSRQQTRREKKSGKSNLNLILLSNAGLEFSYSQSPEHMKGVVLGIFCISTGIGYWLSSLLEVIVRSATNNKWYPSENPNEGTMECYFFLLAGLMIVNFVIFLYVASRYKYRTAPKESEKTANDREEDQLDEPEV